MKANASTRRVSKHLRLVLTISLVILAWYGPAHADPDLNAKARARAGLQAAVMCMDMPPSLNPWGKDCAAQVAARWASCSEASQNHVAELHDCLGFKRPPPLSASDAVKAQKLEQASIDFCTTSSSFLNPRRCKDQVAERFEWCAAPFITHEISDGAFMRCLGLPDRRP